MTTGQPIKVPSDRNKYNNEFAESLQLQIDINQRNLEANRLYKETGQLPASTQMRDTRSNEEKLADVEYLKHQIISDLAPIAEPMFANSVIQGVLNSPLNINNSLFKYLAQNAQTFAQTLSKKYKFGIAGDANDVAIMVQFLEDAYNKTKNTFQSIKGYINSNTNEGNRSRSSVLSANDTDNLKMEIKDLQKRIAEYFQVLDNIDQTLPPNRRMVPIVGQDLEDLLRNLGIIDRMIPTTDQFNQIILDLSESIHTNTPLQDNGLIDLVIDVLKRLPKLSSVQTLADRLERAIRERDNRNIINIIGSINQLFSNILGDPGTLQALNQFHMIYVDRAQQQLNNQQRVSDINTVDAIRANHMRERDMQKAQKVYIINPANDPGNVQVRPNTFDPSLGGGDDGGSEYGEESELGSQGYAPSNASNQSYYDPFAGSASGSSRGSYAQYPRSNEVISNLSGNSQGAFPGLSEVYPVSNPYEQLSSQYAYLEEEPLEAAIRLGPPSEISMSSLILPSATEEQRVSLGENPLHAKRKAPSAPIPPSNFDVYTQHKNVYSKNGRKKISDADWITLRSTYPEEYAYDNAPEKFEFENKIRSGKGIKKGRGLYTPFGDSEINHKNLENNILTIRRKSKTNYMDLPSKHISKHMKNIIHNIVGGKIANFEDIHNLNDEERNYLNKVISKSNLQDRLSVPAPSKDQADKDNHQWEVMRGEIMAGNDSHELVKKFKLLTMKLTRQGLLPKNEVMELFEDLVNLGY